MEVGKSLKLAFLDQILSEKLLESYQKTYPITFNELKINICKIGKTLELAFWKA